MKPAEEARPSAAELELRGKQILEEQKRRLEAARLQSAADAEKKQSDKIAGEEGTAAKEA